MNPRRLAIILGIALAVSVGINLFAATATMTALSGQKKIERELEQRRSGDRRPSTRELLSNLDPETRRTVRRALREAGMRARPEFQASRAARAQAVEAARADPFDRGQVDALLSRSREAEARGRAMLESDALVVLEGLSLEDRRVVATILASRSRNGRNGDRPQQADPSPASQEAPPAESGAPT